MIIRNVSTKADTRGNPPPSKGTRFLKFVASTYDADNRTIEAVLSTGARVDRLAYQEELAVSPDAIDLLRASTGQVKLLDSHNANSLDSVLGTVSNVRIQDGKLLGTLTFDDSPQGKAAEGQVSRKVVTGISIGYSVKAWALANDGGNADARDIWRAMRWELLEVSLVSVPADPGAGTRSASAIVIEPANIENGEDMLTRNHPAGGNAPAPAIVAVTRFDSEGSIAFLDSARQFGLETEARSLIGQNAKGEISPEICRSEILRMAGERQRALTNQISSAIIVGRDEGDTAREGLEDALFSRIMRQAPSEKGRQYRGMNLIDMARFQMRQRGERGVDYMSALDIATRIHSTGDFPNLTTGVGNRVLMAAFQAAPNPLKSLARESSVNDFRSKYSLKLGNFPTLPAYVEGGEVKYTSTSEAVENYKIGTFAQIFTLSRQAIINDDLDAFGDWARKMATAATETEAQQLVALLTSASGAGPTMSDGNALFSVGHGNLAGSGSVISTDALSAARLAMRTQTGIDGKTLAPVVPKTLLVGPQKETEAEKVLASLYAATSEDVNNFAGKLSLEVEPRLAGNPWFVFADPQLAPVIEYAYLNGAAGPQMDSREGFKVLGTEFRVVLDFGCGVIDYRGVYRNPGAAPGG